MIVKCDQCQTRFKIPDEKVTEKGVKVRCTRCQHTFRVKREAAPPPVSPPPPEPSAPPVAAASADPFADLGLPSSSTPAPDLFADLGLPPDPPAGDDPFRAFAPHGAERASPPAPLPPAPLSPSFEAQADLPADVFDSPTKVAAVPSHLREGAPRPAAPRAPLPPVPAFDDGLSLELEPSGSAPPPAAAPPPAPPPAALPGVDDDDFLSMPSSPAAQPAEDPALGAEEAGPELDFSAPPSSESVDVDLGPSSPGMSPDERANLFDLPAASPPRAPTPEPTRKTSIGRITAPSLPAPVALDGPVEKPTTSQDELGLKDRPAAGPGRRAAAWVTNVVVGAALAGLVLVTGAIYLQDGKVELGSYSVERMRTIFAPSRELVARDVSNGLYETRSGRPIFYVRGEVENRGRLPVKARVKVELLDADQLVRAVSGTAGQTPSPEELHGVTSAPELDALVARLEQAATEIAPKAKAPFLVAFYEYPPDLTGVRLRVIVQAAPAAQAVAR